MDFATEMEQIAAGYANVAKAGIEAGERTAVPLRKALRTILHAYDEALKDEATKIPTPLHAAIEDARRVVE